MDIKSGQLNYIEETHSTNTDLLDYVGEVSDGTALYSFNQTAGKGRMGRNWQETKGQGLAISVAYNMSTSMLAPLPLLAGLAVSKAIDESFEVETSLKWSNDVILNQKKLAGVLCESRISKGMARVVVGVGINLLQTEKFFVDNCLEHAISLKMACGENIVLDGIPEYIKKKLDDYINRYLSDGFNDKIIEEYSRKCATLGKEIMVISQGNARKGKACKIDRDGALICDFDGYFEAVHGGEVSVRGIYGYFV